jgi:hypothetical protein
MAQLTLPVVRALLTAISRLYVYQDTWPIFVPAPLRLSYVSRRKYFSAAARIPRPETPSSTAFWQPNTIAQHFHMSAAFAHVFVCLFVDCPTKDDREM